MTKTIPRFYRNFALIFFLSAVFLLLAFVYIMLSQAVVTIKASHQDLNVNMIVDIKERPFESPIQDDTSIPGRIFEFELEETKQYESTGTKDIVSDVVGKATIINDYSREQALVETTRLITADGILLRMKEGIVIQPGERIEVSVYPDNPDEFTTLPPSRFTIPGLWEGLQPHIYAESSSEFSKGGFKVKVVSQQDITVAEKDIETLLENKALEEFKNVLTENETFYSRLVQKEVVKREFNAQVGEEKDSFQGVLGLHITVVAFDELKLVNMVKQNLLQNLPEGNALKDFDANSLTYVVEKYDVENKIAHVKVSGTGKVGIKVNNEILDTSFLSGLGKDEAREWLLKYPEIEDVKIEFSPSWVNKMPRFVERIKIIVE